MNTYKVLLSKNLAIKDKKEHTKLFSHHLVEVDDG
jgi:hypothetical protein